MSQQNNLMTTEELSIIDSKLALLHRTEEDWAAIKAFLTDRDVIAMEAQEWPSAGHLSISDSALLVFTTVEKCTAWIDRAAPGICFIISSLPFSQAINVSDDRHMPLYLDVNYDGRFICYQNNQLSARALLDPKVFAGYRMAKPGPNDPCPCGSGKKYKKCCGRG